MQEIKKGSLVTENQTTKREGGREIKVSIEESKCPLTTQKNSPIYGKLRKTYLAPIKVERNLNKKKMRGRKKKEYTWKISLSKVFD